MGEKTTLPFMTQYGGGLMGSYFFPEFAGAFKDYKPQMYNQLFGKGTDPNSLQGLYGQYVKPYDPYNYLKNYYGRPGGPSDAEQNLLNSSLFGVGAQANLGGANAAAQNYKNLWGGGANGTDFSNLANLYQSGTSHIFGSLGGQIQAPQAPTLGQFQMPQAPAGLGAGFNVPQAPGLERFQMPNAPTINIPGMMQGTYQDLLKSQPGLQDALKRSLDPKIALPSQTIDEIVKSMSSDSALQAYVDRASSGMEAAYEKNLNDRVLEMQSRFAGEGSYLSSPMMQGQGELTANLTAQHLNQLGQLQLGAAEAERGRQYGAASQQYSTEYQRNATQVQLQAQQAAQLAQQFGQMATAAASQQGTLEQKTYADQLQALAQEYSSRASYLSNTYGSMVGAMASGYGSQQGALASMYGAQVGAAANAYGTQANFLSNTYNTGMNASLQQQGIVSNAMQQAMQLMQNGQANSWDQAMKMAQFQYGSDQSALDKLYNSYYQPGQNTSQLLGMFLGLPTVSKTTGGGQFDFGNFLAGVGGDTQAAGKFWGV